MAIKMLSMLKFFFNKLEHRRLFVEEILSVYFEEKGGQTKRRLPTLQKIHNT